jgi:hypothetical protein
VFSFLKLWHRKVAITPVAAIVACRKEISLSDDRLESLKEPLEEIALERKIIWGAETPKQEAPVKTERTLIIPL